MSNKRLQRSECGSIRTFYTMLHKGIYCHCEHTTPKFMNGYKSNNHPNPWNKFDQKEAGSCEEKSKNDNVSFLPNFCLYAPHYGSCKRTTSINHGPKKRK